MIDLEKIQDEISVWALSNNLIPDGVKDSWKPLLGVGQTYGQLNNAYLKRRQGMQGTGEEHTCAMEIAVADLIIFLMHFCSLEGISFEEVLQDTWAKVQEQDEVANPEKGNE